MTLLVTVRETLGTAVPGACQVFCKEFEEISGFNPLERCITIASACNLFYRTKHLQERTLASEPIGGWHAQGKPHSLAALEWLTYLNRKPNVAIRHARNGGKHVILRGDKTFYVDGYNERTRTVYEFNGCFFQEEDIRFTVGHEFRLEIRHSRDRDRRTRCRIPGLCRWTCLGDHSVPCRVEDPRNSDWLGC